METPWILSVRTSHPKACNNGYDLKLKLYAFETFAEARDSMRKVVNSFAFTKNKMFDGKGKLVRMKEFAREVLPEK